MSFMKTIRYTILMTSFFTALLAMAFLITMSAQKVNIDIPDTPASKIIDAGKLISDIKILSSDEMNGRETGTEAGKKAREYIVGRFKSLGLKTFGEKYTQNFSFITKDKKTISGANVVGYITGSKNPQKYIVITAHYDHLGVRSGQIYNGADDNASGTAALFALAEYFANNRPQHSLIFFAVDAEEKGLSGSKFFVANPPVGKESILLNINMDMISRNDKNELYVAGFYHYPFLKKYVEPIRKSSKIKLLYGHDSPDLGSDDWTNSTDHASFHRQKIPFMYFGVEDHKDYHKPTDIFKNINKKFYVNAVEAIVKITECLDRKYNRKEK